MTDKFGGYTTDELKKLAQVVYARYGIDDSGSVGDYDVRCLRNALLPLIEAYEADAKRIAELEQILPCGHPVACRGLALDNVTCGWCADLKDLGTLVHHCSTAYDYLSRGLISKPLTFPETVIAVHEEHVATEQSADLAEAVRQARAEMRERSATLVEYMYDHGLVGVHQGEMCIRVAASIRALPDEPPAPGEGKPVFDPRTGLTEYSNNAALVWADYLTLSEVDETALIAAANICDEPVDLPADSEGNPQTEPQCRREPSRLSEPTSPREPGGTSEPFNPREPVGGSEP